MLKSRGLSWLEIVCAVRKIRLFIVHVKIKGLIVCAVRKIRLFIVHVKIKGLIVAGDSLCSA